MKKVSEAEVKMMEFKRHGRYAQNPIICEVRELSVGESLWFEKNEWTPKTHPSTYLGNIRARTGRKFTVRTLKDDSSFLIQRTA